VAISTRSPRPMAGLVAGCRARIQGLLSEPHYNGKECVLMRFSEGTQTWSVEVGDSEPQLLGVRPANLVFAGAQGTPNKSSRSDNSANDKGSDRDGASSITTSSGSLNQKDQSSVESFETQDTRDSDSSDQEEEQADADILLWPSYPFHGEVDLHPRFQSVLGYGGRRVDLSSCTV